MKCGSQVTKRDFSNLHQNLNMLLLIAVNFVDALQITPPLVAVLEINMLSAIFAVPAALQIKPPLLAVLSEATLF